MVKTVFFSNGGGNFTEELTDTRFTWFFADILLMRV